MCDKYAGMHNFVYNFAGERIQVNAYKYQGTLVQHESVGKLPRDLVIPNNHIRLMDSIGQGELDAVVTA